MQRTLPRWKRLAFHLTMLCCLCSVSTIGQFRYQFTAVAGTYSNLSNGNDALDDDYDNALSGLVNIGFSFSYNCNTYTNFRASSNGFISLGDNTTQNMSVNNLTITGNGPIIAPLWDDLRLSTSGVTYRTTGSSPNRTCTIQWSAVRWGSGASSTGGISFQIKLYETSNIIEFIYSQNSGSLNNPSASIGISGGSINTDFYSVSGNNTSAVATYGTETSNISQKPNTGMVYRWTPLDMGFLSGTATQAVTSNISRCNNLLQQVIGVEINTQGCRNAINLTQFRISMAGTTNIADVSGIHIYYTGKSNAYSPVQEFNAATITPAAGTINVTGSQQLLTGVNYFWIAYDIKYSATAGNVVDATCTQVTLAGFSQNITPSSPTGSRSIVDCPRAPGGITNSSLWLKANLGAGSTNNTKLPTWNDQSGLSRHAANANANNQPTYYDNAGKNLNYNPVVEFDEADQDKDYADFLDIAYTGVLSGGNNPYEVYAVIVPGVKNLSTPGKFLFSGAAGANNFNAFDVRSNYSINDSWNMNDLIVSNTWAVDSILMLTFDYNYLQREAFKSGTSLGTRVSSTERTSLNGNGAIAYQRSGNLEFYDGGIAEIITFANTTHSTIPRYKVESYLATKYGVTLSHDYLSSTGTTIWSRSLNSSYNNNIIGLARDNTSALLQKQAKSTVGRSDILRLHIGPSLSVNQANNTGGFTATDTSFFMVGHNGGVPLNLGNEDKPTGICCRLEREWLVQKTNFTNTTVTLVFDFTAITPGTIPMNAADLRLLVDDDGDFSNAQALNTPTVTITAAASVATITVPVAQFNSRPYFTLGSVSFNTVLPLDITSFTGLCRGEEAQLRWTAAGEMPNDIIIERSADKHTFSTVGSVKKNVTGSYSWTDRSPLPGAAYYRLKAIGEQGGIRYSAIATVAGCNTKTVQFSTNPVTDVSTLMLQLPQTSQGEITVFDMVGRRIDVPGLTGKRSFTRGVHYLPVHVPGTVTGWYTLHVVLNGERQAFRLLKK